MIFAVNLTPKIPACRHYSGKVILKIMRFLGIAYFFLFTVRIVVPLYGANPLDVWHWRNPEPTGARLHAVAFGAGQYVAVGETGVIMTSVDSRNWTSVSIPVGATLRGIAYGANRFVAVGDSGTIVSSPDGWNWQSEEVPSFVHLNSIAWGNGLFVAVGMAGGILTSSDGHDWILRSIGGDDLRTVAFGNGKFVAVGGFLGAGSSLNNPPPRPLLISSSDGISWVSELSASARALTGVTFGNGRWVAVNQSGIVNVSVDGESWLPSDVRIELPGVYQLTYGLGNFVLVGGSSSVSLGQVWTSQDGFTWLSHRLPSFANPSESVVYGDYGFVAVGGQWPGATQTVLRSNDGQNWETLPFDWRDMTGWSTFAGQYFFIQASRYQDPVNIGFLGTDVWLSTTGQEWRRTTMSSNAWLNALTWGNNRYVSVGSAGAAVFSEDGVTWSASTTPTTNLLSSIAFGGDMFVAVGVAGTIITSDDGVHWIQRNSGSSNDLTTVAWNGIFVVTEPTEYDYGKGAFPPGAVLTSPDGFSWQRHYLTNGPSVQNVTRWRTGFAGIVSGRGAVSQDGINWTQTGPSSLLGMVSPIFSVDGTLAYVPDYTSPTLAVSTDGTNWSAKPLPFPPSIYNYFLTGISGGKDTFLISDADGSVIQSEPVVPRPPSLNDLPFVSYGGPGRDSTIEIHVSGSSPFAYQWKRNGDDILGATNRLLSLPSSESTGNFYSVEVRNDYGTKVTTSVALTDPSSPSLSLEYDNAISLKVNGDTGRRYLLEMADHIGSDEGPIPWTETMTFRIESNNEVRVFPRILLGGGRLFFRASVLE